MFSPSKALLNTKHAPTQIKQPYISVFYVSRHVSRLCQDFFFFVTEIFHSHRPNKKEKTHTHTKSGGVLLPGQTVTTHGVAGGGAVALLDAVDECAVQAGFALLQAPVLFEAAAPAGHTTGILSVAKATFLRGLTGEIHRVRGGAAGEGLGVFFLLGEMCSW